MRFAPTTYLPWCLFLIVALVPRTGESTTVKRLNHSEMVRAAAKIVHADCLDSTPELEANGRRVFTRVRFTVRETFKGKASNTLELKIPGGKAGGISYVVHGMPTFNAGEEVVLYSTVAHKKSGVRVPVGLDQGCYRIKRPAPGQTVAPQARRDMRELLLVEPGKAPAKGTTETLTLEQLETKIRAEVARQARAAQEGK